MKKQHPDAQWMKVITIEGIDYYLEKAKPGMGWQWYIDQSNNPSLYIYVKKYQEPTVIAVLDPSYNEYRNTDQINEFIKQLQIAAQLRDEVQKIIDKDESTISTSNRSKEV